MLIFIAPCLAPLSPSSNSCNQTNFVHVYSTVISGFAIVILGTLGLLFNAENHEVVGSTGDPADGRAVAQTILVAVLVYIVRLPNP